jgi:anti-sigma regulatory factor (Ser/Thr protein kinase)
MLDARPTSTRRSIVPDVHAPVVARRALERFSSQLENDVVERSRLVITEVVTNAVKHAGLTATQRIDLEIGLADDLLRIEITDDGPGFELAVGRRGRDDGSGGWGLFLVDRLTDRWGVDFRHSTRVWCEFDPHEDPPRR